MMDRSIPYVSLIMRTDTLADLPATALPPEYGWRCFRKGDEQAWARIETSAGEFPDEASALAGFRRCFPTDELLDERMLFLTDDGVPFATATAWYGADGPDGGEGRLHWVAIDAAHQRRRLSFPLVSLAMARLQALGYTAAYLTTQTASWPAIKVYRRFGFRPAIRGDEDITGWRIVSEATGIDFLKEL